MLLGLSVRIGADRLSF